VKLAQASFEQAKYYGWGMFRGEHNPHRIDPYHKLQPAAAHAVQILMLFLLPLQFATGILMWDIKRFSAFVEVMGGLRVVSTVHVLIFIFFVF
jgi:thiosulfate reductase cytochrome b subunit